jgi:hypothetical protein
MTKIEIISELDIISAIAEVNDNILICTKIRRIRETLINEWNNSDVYYEELIKNN